MKRVVILGSSGSGKSTLARSLGETLGIPVVHLDVLYWHPGWVEGTAAELVAALEPLLRTALWITEGNYSRTWPARLAAADTVIFLDMPRWLCILRVIRRSLADRDRTRPDLPLNCPERPMSVLRDRVPYVWNYPKERRPKAMAALEQHRAGKTVVVLRSPRAVKRFLHEVRNAAATPTP